jgi:hypothetical protein
LAKGTEVYTCGSDAMMNDLEKILKKKRHSRRLFFKESFSGSHASSGEAGLRVLQWIRNIHVYASLLFSMLFLFFGFSGFLAGRPELFDADAPRTLPANVALEKGELGGFYKAQFDEDFSLTDYSREDDYSVLELRSPLDRVVEIEISHADRSYTVTEYHPLPPELTGKDDEALALQLSKQLKGKLNRDTISQDEELLYFRLDSVWLKSFITVDRANKQYVLTKEPVPLVKAMILLHKGKMAEAYQQVVMDLTAWAIVIASITGMIMIFLPKNPRVRLIAGVLIGLSVVLFIAMIIHR